MCTHIQCMCTHILYLKYNWNGMQSIETLHDPLAQGTEARWLPTIWQHGILHLLQFLLTLPEKKHKPSSLSRNKQSTKGQRTYNKKYNMHILSRLPEIHFTCWCLEVVIIIFFTWALLATYLFTHVVYDLYVFRVGQESWRVHSDVVMKSWHHV